MADIYEIDNRLQTLCNEMFDTETGEIVQDEETFNKLFDEISLDLNDKIENTMCFVKNLNADAKAIKEEKAQLDKREKQKEALADRLQNRIDYYIKHQYMDANGNVDNQALNKYKLKHQRLRYLMVNHPALILLIKHSLIKSLLRLKPLKHLSSLI